MNQTDFDIPIEQEFFKVDYDVIVRLKDEILSELSESERILLSKTCKNYKKFLSDDQTACCRIQLQ